MGDWTIRISGTGAHHNEAYPLDANRMAARFIAELKDAEHVVHVAEIAYGGGPLEERDDMADPAAYEEQLRVAGRGGTPPSDEPMAQWFAWSHLPEPLQRVSRRFGDLADRLIASLPRNAERTVALRKLLESKDAAVRARIAK